MPTKGSEFIVKFQDIALPKDLETRIAARIQTVVAEEIAHAGPVIEKAAKDSVLQFDPKIWRGKWILKAATIKPTELVKNKLQIEAILVK